MPQFPVFLFELPMKASRMNMSQKNSRIPIFESSGYVSITSVTVSSVSMHKSHSSSSSRKDLQMAQNS